MKSMSILALILVATMSQATTNTNVVVVVTDVVVTASDPLPVNPDPWGSTSTYQELVALRLATTRENLTYLPDWVSLTNSRAAYLADKIDYTNKVMQVSDAPTRQTIRALASMTQDLQEQVSSLKRVILAICNNSTNDVVIGR